MLVTGPVASKLIKSTKRSFKHSNSLQLKRLVLLFEALLFGSFALKLTQSRLVFKWVDWAWIRCLLSLSGCPDADWDDTVTNARSFCAGNSSCCWCWFWSISFFGILSLLLYVLSNVIAQQIFAVAFSCLFCIEIQLLLLSEWRYNFVSGAIIAD